MGLDAANFDAIYAANADRLYSTAYRLLGDADAAADVVQDAFLKAYTATDEIREPAAWLTTVARNNALNVLRRTGRLAPLAEEVGDDDTAAPPLVADEPAADPLHAAATADALAIADELLASLSPAQRTALLLFHAQEQPIPVIAEMMGRTVNATTVFLHRSRAALRSRYADRVYRRMNVPPECLALRPELIAHVEGKAVGQVYLDHLAVDSICQTIEAELRGMGRVLGVLPLVPAPSGLYVSVETALASHGVGTVAAGSGSTASTSGGAPATSAGSQSSHGVAGFLGTTAGKVAAGVVTLAIVVAGVLVFQSPAEPAPTATTVAQVLSAFDTHNCAIRHDRTLVCWGDSNNRKLDVPEGEFVAVSAGHSLSCAIRVDGTISCWGYHGADNETSAPPGAFTALSTGGQHTCAIRTDGTLACWGWNLHGQADAPTGTFAAVAGGTQHTCAIRSDGSLACWGNNDHGQADPPDGTFRFVAAGQWDTCAIRDDGTLTCWGSSYPGEAHAPEGMFSYLASAQLLPCNTGGDLSLVCWGRRVDRPAAVPTGSYKTVSLGSGFLACAIRTDDGIDCWAEGGSWPGSDAPSGTFTAVAVGGAHACAVDTEGRITCWGQDSRGETNPPPGTYGVFAAEPTTQVGAATLVPTEPPPTSTVAETPEPTLPPTPPTSEPTLPPPPEPTPLAFTGADIHITAGDLTLSYEYDQPWCPIGAGLTFGTYPAGVPGTDGREWSTQMFILAWSDGAPTDWSFILSTPPGVSSAENERRLSSGAGMNFVEIAVEEETPTRLLITTRFVDPLLAYGETLPGTVEIACR